MQYNNAQNGIKRLFSAQILELVGLVLVLLGLMGLTILGLVGLVFMITGLVRNVLGILEAAKDDENFRKASIFVIAHVILYVAGRFLGRGILGGILGLGNYVSLMLSVWYVALGISSVASGIGNMDIAEYSKGRAKIILILYAVILVGTVLSVIPGIAEIATLATSILAMVAVILYIFLLHKGQKMF